MAAPSLASAGSISVVTATSGTITSGLGGAIGNVVILAVTQDGTGTNMTLTDTNSTIEALDGTDNTMTPLAGNPYQVGNPAAAKLFVWLGRALTSSFLSADVASSAGNDLYGAMASYNNVSTGTTLATVIENGSAGTANTENGTGTTVSDVDVVTLGVDRYAVNVVGINDDATGITAAGFTGETPGDWTDQWGGESGTGTDGTLMGMGVQVTSVATQGGGTCTITSDGWGVVGFALIGTTVVSTVTTRKTWPALQAVNRAGTY